MKFDIKKHLAVTLVAGGCLLAPGARAHGDAPHSAKAAPVLREQKEWGIAGDPKAARRKVRDPHGRHHALLARQGLGEAGRDDPLRASATTARCCTSS